MNSAPRPAIVFTTPVLSHPPVGGPALRVENSVLALAQIAEVHVHCRADWDELGGESAAEFFRRHVSSFRLASGRGPWRSMIRRIASGQVACCQGKSGFLPLRWATRAVRSLLHRLDQIIPRPDDAREIVQLASQTSAQVVWFGYGNISFDVMQRVRSLAPGLRLVCDTDSVWSRFVLRELEVENDPRRKAQIREEGLTKEREEIAWMKFCDVTTAVSAVDADYYESLNTDGRRVMLFRNVINLDSYASPPEAAPDLRSPSIFLAGSFWEKSPMEHAARWFLEKVFPRILATYPAAQLYIAGNRSDQVLADVRHEHVHVLGRVASVLPYLCHADVAVVPLFFESGTRFKILEAGACRIPVVSTTLGAEGIDVVNGENIMLADDPEAFAAAVVEVLNDPGRAREFGRGLHALIAERYSLPALADEGRAVLRAISPGSGL